MFACGLEAIVGRAWPLNILLLSALSGECLLADQTGAMPCAYNFDSDVRYWLDF